MKYLITNNYNNIIMNFILIDGSYYIFYRYHALCTWWKLAKHEDETDIPYENERFIEKYKDTFVKKIHEIEKKLKIKDATIYVGKDCPRKNIWRNKNIEDYKGGRVNCDYMKLLFDIAYNNNDPLKTNLFLKAGCKKVIEESNVEADDIIALTSKHILSKYPDAKIWIITSDMDYLQLACENVELYDLKFKKLTERKSSYNDAKKDLFVKILTGDKSDNIKGVFKKCGPKTACKYFDNKELFDKKLQDVEGAMERYLLNKKLIDFNEIPEELVNKFMDYYELNLTQAE